MSKRKLEGTWWLPESPERAIAGVLVIHGDGRSELRLIGSLRSNLYGAEKKEHDGVTSFALNDDQFEQNSIYPVIHGRVGQKSLTLDDCFQVFQTADAWGTVGSERVHVHRVFEGAHFLPGNPPMFFQATVNLAGLAHWVGRSGIQQRRKYQDKDGSGLESISHEVGLSKLPDEDFEGPNGEKLSIRHTYSISRDEPVSVTYAQDFCFVLRAQEDKTADDFLVTASALQDLVTLGTGRVAEFTSIDFSHQEVRRELRDKAYHPGIPMTAQWIVRAPKSARRINLGDIVFTLNDFGGPEKITRWLEVAEKNQSTLARVMSTRYKTDMYVTDRFFNRAASLERYDQDKYGDDKHYYERLKRCAAHAGQEFLDLVGDTETWAKRVKNGRHTVAHHNPGILDATAEQIVLGDSAYWLYVLCLLKDADAPPIVASKISQQPLYKRLAKDVRAVLAA